MGKAYYYVDRLINEGTSNTGNDRSKWLIGIDLNVGFVWRTAIDLDIYSKKQWMDFLEEHLDVKTDIDIDLYNSPDPSEEYNGNGYDSIESYIIDDHGSIVTLKNFEEISSSYVSGDAPVDINHTYYDREGNLIYIDKEI